MRLLGSFMFLVGALSIGAYAYFPASSPRYSRLVDVVHIAELGAGADQGAESATSVAGGRSFAPDPSLVQSFLNAVSMRAPASPERGHDRGAHVVVAEAPSQAVDNPTRDGGSASPTSAPWRTVVREGREVVRAAPKADDYMARYELVRNLQTELRRVGCYDGNIDGDWGGGSKRAASAFLHKVNATLPVDTPDYILLTLIQGHMGQACGVECPSGQGLASDGRCVPNMIVARGPARGTLLGRQTLGARGGEQIRGAQTSVARAAPTAPVPTPKPASAIDPDAAQLDIARAGQTAVVAAAAGTSAATAGRPEPLPGRMAIGAPPPRPEDVAAPAPARMTITVDPTVALAMPPLPQQAPSDLRALKRQARLSVDDLAGGAAHQGGRGAHAVRSPRSAAIGRPDPVHVAPQRRTRAANAYRPGGRGSVQTSVGKVRRGSPQHNLMLSLGGVF